jgi:hypothetical protein
MWRLPQEAARTMGGDPWARKLALAAIGCVTLLVLLFVIFKLSLGSGVSDLRAMTLPGH